MRYVLDPADPPRSTPEEEARLDALTREEVERNAREDPDNPPMTEEELERGLFGRDVRLLRRRLGLTQGAFAERYSIGLPRLRDWEQGRYQPDSVVVAYVTLIARDAERVAQVLAEAASVDRRRAPA